MGRARVDRLIAAGRTTTAPFARPLMIYVTYMTAVAGADGVVHHHDDPYSLDAALAAQLHDGRETASLDLAEPDISAS